MKLMEQGCFPAADNLYVQHKNDVCILTSIEIYVQQHYMCKIACTYIGVLLMLITIAFIKSL
jgi:hypothetical protein